MIDSERKLGFFIIFIFFVAEVFCKHLADLTNREFITQSEMAMHARNFRVSIGYIIKDARDAYEKFGSGDEDETLAPEEDA